MTTWIYVRSTINMAGLHRDEEAWIDADVTDDAGEFVFAPLLEARYIVPVDPPWWEIPPEEESE